MPNRRYCSYIADTDMTSYRLTAAIISVICCELPYCVHCSSDLPYSSSLFKEQSIAALRHAVCTVHSITCRLSAHYAGNVFIEAATADPSRSPGSPICIKLGSASSRLIPPKRSACCKLNLPCSLPKQRVLKLWLTHTASWAVVSLTSARQQAMFQRQCCKCHCMRRKGLCCGGICADALDDVSLHKHMLRSLQHHKARQAADFAESACLQHTVHSSADLDLQAAGRTL